MNDSFNPYQPPTTNTIQTYNSGDCWTEGKLLVMPFSDEPQQLPHRCIYCNKPVEKSKKKIFYWHNPLWALLILLTPLIYLIVAYIIRKKVTLHFAICTNHKVKTLIKISITYAVMMITFYLMYHHLEYATVGFMVLLIAIIYLIIVSNPLSISKVKDELVYFRKCGKPFLDSLS